MSQAHYFICDDCKTLTPFTEPFRFIDIRDSLDYFACDDGGNDSVSYYPSSAGTTEYFIRWFEQVNFLLILLKMHEEHHTRILYENSYQYDNEFVYGDGDKTYSVFSEAKVLEWHKKTMGKMSKIFPIDKIT